MSEDMNASPHNIDAERAVLGSLMISEHAFFRVAPIITADDFFRDAHRRLYAVMLEMVHSGVQPDTITIKRALSADELQGVGGSAYVSSLIDGIPNAAQVEQYAQIVARESKRRHIIDVANRAMRRAMDGDDEPETIAAEALSKLAASATREDAQSQPFGKIVSAAFRAAEERRVNDRPIAMTSGLTELDAYDVFRRHFIAVGSPSGHGKSGFAKDLAVGLATNGHPTAFFTLESTPEEISWRYVSAETGIAHNRVQDWRRYDADEFAKAAGAEARAHQLPIFASDGARSIEAIDAECRRLKAVHNIDAVLIDYIQLIEGPAGIPAHQVEQRMAHVGRWLLRLALELRIAVIATSQVREDWTKRADGKLFATDLKYARAITESARCVLMFQRPHVEDPSQRPCQVIFKIAKHNEGRTRPEYEMHFDEVHQKFNDGSCQSNGCARIERRTS